MTKHIYPYCETEAELEAMIPSTPGTGGIGEHMLYSLMKEYLPSDWHVLWHRNFADSYKHEIDFLVFVPGKGVVNVDAKGHGWGFEDNRIYCDHSGGRSYKDGHDSPFMQAENAVATVNKTFISWIGGNWGAYGSLVAFIDPFSYPGYEAYYIDNVKERLRQNPHALEHQILSVLSTPSAQKYHKYFTMPVMSGLLSKLLVKSKAQPIEDTDFFSYDKKSEGALSLKQQRVSAELKKRSNLHVIGAAGTGKTVVAMMLAQEYVRAGKRVLYICFNESLRQKLSRDFKAGMVQNVSVSSFFGLPNLKLPSGRALMDLCGWRQYAGAGGVIDYGSIPSLCGKNGPDWKGAIPRFVKNGLGRYSESYGGAYDMLLVDEAQDMDNETIMMLFSLLKDERKIVVFSDQGQVFYHADWELDTRIFGEEDGQVKCISLDENWRNTSLIHDHFKSYQECDDVIALIQDGVKDVTEINDVEQTLKGLLAAGRQPKDIAVLSADKENIKLLKAVHNSASSKPVSVSDNLERWWSNEVILKQTVRRFKGLESPIVIFIPSKGDDDVIRYVAESRAKYELYILALK